MPADSRTPPAQRRIAANALASMLNVVLGSVMVLVLYRLLLDRLGAEALGVWSLLIASVSSARLAELGLAASVTRYVAVAHASTDHRQAVRLVQTATLTLAAVGSLAGILAMVALPHLLGRFIPPSQLDIALHALPWALVAFVIGLAGSAVQSALDGCQRVDLRVWISMAGQAALLCAAFPLTATYGLAGVAMAQVLQSLVVLVGSWATLHGQLTGLPVMPVRWSYPALREILGYSALFQLNSLLLLLLDPLAKFVLARFGGLSATAYFDMANQLVQRLRLLPVSAVQILVPVIAHSGEDRGERILGLYARSYRLIFAATIPGFCLAAALIPAISEAWTGSHAPLLTGMTWICLAGWGLSTLGTPSYYTNLGLGTIGTNTAGHALTTLVAGVLGWWGGVTWGAFGVCSGYAAGVAAGSLYVQLRLGRQLGLSAGSLIPKESLRLVLLSFAGLAACLAADAYLAGGPLMTRIGMVTALFLITVGSGIWSHPLRQSVIDSVLGSLRSPRHQS